MTTSQKITLGILSTIAIIMLVMVSFLILHNYQQWAVKPLGGILETPPTVQFLLANETPTTVPPGTLAPTIDFDVTNLPNTPICGGPLKMDLLMIGTDSRSGRYEYGLADAIRLVRIDFVTPRVFVLEFPRDLWVEIPEISDNIQQDHERLNQAYLYGNPGFNYYEHPSEGPGLLARTLNLNFGANVDHYVAVSMKTFIEVVDVIGGIDVNLPDGLDGRTGTDNSRRLIFPKGEQHLSGEQALTLARIRNQTVFTRAEHQNMVMCAVRKKMISPQVIPQLSQILTTFQENIQTDLTPEQIGQLACLGVAARPENIVFASFPNELFKESTVYDPVFKSFVFAWDVDFDILRQYTTQFQAGYWPSQQQISTNSAELEDAFLCP